MRSSASRRANADVPVIFGNAPGTTALSTLLDEMDGVGGNGNNHPKTLRVILPICLEVEDPLVAFRSPKVGPDLACREQSGHDVRGITPAVTIDGALLDGSRCRLTTR